MPWTKTTSKQGTTSNLEQLQETKQFYISQLPDGCFFMYDNSIFLKTAYVDNDNFPLSFAIASGKKFEHVINNPLVLLVTGTITIGADLILLDN